MFWKKKRDMIDIGLLQKRGIIKSKKIDVSASKGGFIELKPSASQNSQSNSSSSPGFFDFFGNSTSSLNSSNSSAKSSSESSSASSENSYSKREIDKKLEEIDNKLYRLEQRLELIERKIGVGNY